MEHYAGIDVSLELSSVCVVDGRGKIVKEAKVASEPEALVCFFKELGVPVNRIGLASNLPPPRTRDDHAIRGRRQDVDANQVGEHDRRHKARPHGL